MTRTNKKNDKLMDACIASLPKSDEPNKSIYEKLRDDDYKTKLEYVSYKHRSDVDYVAKREAYKADVSRLNDEFKRDALAEAGLTDHPKADRIFAYAWQEGHSAGFHDVLSHLTDLADLFLDDLK